MLILLRTTSDIRSQVLKILDVQALLFDRKEGLTSTQVVNAKGVRSGEVFAGRCYNFDGVNDYVAIPTTVTVAGKSKITFAAWIKPNTVAGTQTIFAESTGTSGYTRFAAYLSGNKLRMNYRDASSDPAGSSVSVDSTANIVAGVWTHVALVFDSDNNTQKLYINGELDTTSNNVTDAIGTSATLGINIGRFPSGSLYYGGRIYDSRLFHEALTDVEITSVYSQEVINNEKFFFKMDEGDGTTAFDSSRQGNHGTITNATLSTFHTTDAGVNYSWLNQVGYTESDGATYYLNNDETGLIPVGVQIPRDESNITKCTAYLVGGAQADLQHVGLVKLNADLVESNCATPDGSDDYAQFNYDLTGLSIASYEGTATPTIDTVNDRITLTAGTFYNLILSDGNEFPISEGGGTKSECVTDDTKHIDWVNTTETPFWAGRQSTLNYNIINGCSIITHATNQTKYIPYQKDGTPTHYTTAIGEAKTEAPAGAWHNDAETKLLAQPAPSLLDKFVHGGTFDGSTHSVSVGDILTDNADFSIAVELKIISLPGNVSFVSTWDNSFNGFSLGYVASANKIRSWANDGASGGLDIATPTVGGSYHIVLTYQNSTDTLRAWLDGVYIGASTFVDTVTHSALRLGTGNANYGNSNIRVSNFRAFNTQLSEAEVQEVFDYKPIVSGEICHLVLNNANNFEDFSGNGNNGTLTGSEDTFWVEEYNNLFFDASGVPVSYGYDDIEANYLGLNRIFADTTIDNEKKNMVICSEPQTGADLNKILKFTNQL